MIRTPFDNLLASGTETADVYEEPLVHVPLAGEFPEETTRRTVTNQLRKARDLASYGVPAYADKFGDPQAVTDEAGAPLTGFSKKTNTAFDSLGVPRSLIRQPGGKPPVLGDAYEGAEIKTDQKTGAQFKVKPGLPKWRVGTDETVVKRNEILARDKEVKQVADVLGRKLSIDEGAFVQGGHQQKAQKRALSDILKEDFQGQAKIADGTPFQDVRAQVAAFYDAALADKSASATEWFSSNYTEKAKANRDRLLARKAQALGHVDAMEQRGRLLEQQQEIIAPAKEQKRQLAEQRLELQLQAMEAQGLDTSHIRAQIQRSSEIRAQKEAQATQRATPVAAAQAQAPQRGGNFLTDTGVSLGIGINSVLKMAGDLYGLATGDMDNPASRLGKENIEWYEGKKSGALQKVEKERRAAMDALPEDDEAGRAWEWVKATFSSPRMITALLAEQAPNLVPALGAGKLAGTGAAKLLLKNAADDAAKVLALKTAGKIGVSTAVGTGAVMQGSDVGGDQYTELVALLHDMPPEQAAAIPEIADLLQRGATLDHAKLAFALTQARKTGALAGGVSIGSQFLPGAMILERAAVGGVGKNLAGNILVRAGKGFAGEAVQEMVEEGGGLAGKNILAQPVDPQRRIGKGMGETLAMAGATGGIFGGIFGAVGGVAGREEAASGTDGTAPSATPDDPSAPPPPPAAPSAGPTPLDDDDLAKLRAAGLDEDAVARLQLVSLGVPEDEVDAMTPEQVKQAFAVLNPPAAQDAERWEDVSGQVIQKGDEFQDVDGIWRPVQTSIGSVAAGKFRRKLAAETPGDTMPRGNFNEEAVAQLKSLGHTDEQIAGMSAQDAMDAIAAAVPPAGAIPAADTLPPAAIPAPDIAPEPLSAAPEAAAPVDLSGLESSIKGNSDAALTDQPINENTKTQGVPAVPEAPPVQLPAADKAVEPSSQAEVETPPVTGQEPGSNALAGKAAADATPAPAKAEPVVEQPASAPPAAPAAKAGDGVSALRAEVDRLNSLITDEASYQRYSDARQALKQAEQVEKYGSPALKWEEQDAVLESLEKINDGIDQSSRSNWTKGEKVRDDKELGGVFKTSGNGVLFRGVSVEDWARIQKQGFLDTDGRGVITKGEEINLSQHSRTAVSYIPNGKGGVVLAIKPEGLDLFRIGADDYIRAKGRIPLSSIVAASPEFIKGDIGEVYLAKAKPPAAPAAPAPAPVAGTAAPGAKEPWQMTREEWVRRELDLEKRANPNVATFDVAVKRLVDAGETPTKAREFILNLRNAGHESALEKAIREGKPVPASVLADYPDLAAQAKEPSQMSRAEQTGAKEPAPAAPTRQSAKVSALIPKETQARLAKMGIMVREDADGHGMGVDIEGDALVMLVSPDAFMARLNQQPVEQRIAFLATAREHEITHLAWLESIRREWLAKGKKAPDGTVETLLQAFQREARAVAAVMGKKTRAAVEQGYGEALSDENAAAEFIRQLDEMAKRGDITEGMMDRIKEIIARLRAVLKEWMDKKAVWPKEVQKAYEATGRVKAELEAMGERMREDGAAKAENPAPAPAEPQAKELSAQVEQPDAPLPPLLEVERRRGPLIAPYRAALERVEAKLADEDLDADAIDALERTRAKIEAKLLALESKAVPGAKRETAEERAAVSSPEPAPVAATTQGRAEGAPVGTKIGREGYVWEKRGDGWYSIAGDGTATRQPKSDAWAEKQLVKSEKGVRVIKPTPSSPAPAAATAAADTRSAAEMTPAERAQPAGQRKMANEAASVATVTVLNNKVRAKSPSEAWSNEQIQAATGKQKELDAIRDDLLPIYNRLYAKESPAPAPAEPQAKEPSQMSRAEQTGAKEPAPPDISAQSIADTIPAHSVPVKAVRAVVARLVERLPGAAPTTVIEDGKDFPQVIKDKAAEYGVSLNRIGGVYHGGRVWLNAAGLSNAGRIASVFLHEQAGHHAIDAILDGISPGSAAKLAAMLKSGFKAEWEHVAGHELTKEEAELEAALVVERNAGKITPARQARLDALEKSQRPRYPAKLHISETLARIMESRTGMLDAKRDGAWQRIVDWIRTVLAKAGFRQWSREDAEALLRRGVDRLRTRRDGGGAADARLSIMGGDKETGTEFVSAARARGNEVAYRTVRNFEEAKAIMDAVRAKDIPALLAAFRAATVRDGHALATKSAKMDAAEKKGAVPVFTSPYPTVAALYNEGAGLMIAIEHAPEGRIYTSTRAGQTQGMAYSALFPDSEHIIDARAVKDIHILTKDERGLMGQYLEFFASQKRQGAYKNAFTDKDAALVQANIERSQSFLPPVESLGRPFTEVSVTLPNGLSVKKGDKIRLESGTTGVLDVRREGRDQIPTRYQIKAAKYVEPTQAVIDKYVEDNRRDYPQWAEGRSDADLQAMAKSNLKGEDTLNIGENRIVAKWDAAAKKWVSPAQQRGGNPLFSIEPERDARYLELAKEPSVSGPILRPDTIAEARERGAGEEQGATPLGFPPEQADEDRSTGISHAYTEGERAKRGMTERDKWSPFGDEAVLAEAKRRITENPGVMDDLVNELTDAPREVDGVETMILMRATQIEEQRLDGAMNDKSDGGRAKMDASLERLEKLYAIDEVIGSIQGHAFRLRQRQLAGDFSLARMLRVARAKGNGGEALSKEQVAEIKELHDKIAALEKKVAESGDGGDAMAMYQRVVEELTETMKRDKSTRAEYSAKLKAKETALLEEARNENLFPDTDEEEGSTAINLPPESANAKKASEKQMRVAIGIGRATIDEGHDTLDKFTDAMVKKLGKGFAPYAADIFKMASAIEEVTAPKPTKKPKPKTPAPAGESPTEEPGEDEKPTFDGEKPLTQRDAYELIKWHVAEGAGGGVDGQGDVVLAEAIRLATVDFQETHPDITEREVRDLFTQYGKPKFPNQEAVAKKLREINRIGKLISAVEDAQRGVEEAKAAQATGQTDVDLTEPLHSGLQRDPATQAVREKEKARIAAMKELVAAAKAAGLELEHGPKTLKSSLDAAKSRMRNAIEDIQKEIATRVRQTKAVGIEYDIEAKALQKELAKLRKQRDEIFGPTPKKPLTDAQRLAMALAAAKKSEESWNERLKNARLGQFSTPGIPTRAITSVELESVKARAAKARDAVKELEANDPALLLAAAKKSVAARAEKLKERIRAGDFEPKQKKDIAEDKELHDARFELDKLKEQFNRGVFERMMARRTRKEKFFGAIFEVLNVSRAMMTGGDLSAVFRQGAFIGLARPSAILRNIRPMLAAFADARNQHRIETEIRNRANSTDYKRAKLDFTQSGGTSMHHQEEAHMSRWINNEIPAWLRKIPVVGFGIEGARRFTAASARAYSTFLNLMRADAFDVLTANLSKDGSAPTLEEMKAIANFINVATGRGYLPQKLQSAAVPMNALFFAPKNAISRFQLLAGQPFYGGTKKTRKLIAKEYARFAAGVAAVYVLASLMQGDDDEPMETDPRSSDFGKIRFGNTRLDPMAGLLQPAVFASRMASGESKTISGKVKELSGDGVKYGGDTRTSITGRFLRSKLAPGVGMTLDLMDGKNVVGQPVTPGSAASQMVVPLAYRDIAAVMQENGATKGAVLSALAILGMGANTFEPNKPKSRGMNADAVAGNPRTTVPVPQLQPKSNRPVFQGF